MPIQFSCPNCGKKFAAGDELAGRTIRCKQCGKPVAVPSEAAAARSTPRDESDLSDLSSSLAALEAASSFSGSHVAESDTPLPTRGGKGGKNELAAGVDEEFVEKGRPNYRFSFPGATAVDTYLPFALVIGSVIWLWSTTSSEPADPTWLNPVRFLVLTLSYVGIIFPLTRVGVKMSAQSGRYQLPRTSGWRTFAACFPGFAMAGQLWMMGDNVLAAILGVAVGAVIALSMLFLLLRLKPHEYAGTTARAGGFFFGGAAAAALLLFVINLLILNIMTSTQSATNLSGSPLGEGFAWAEKPANVAVVPPKKKPKDKPTTIASTTTSPVEPVAIVPPTPSSTTNTAPVEPTVVMNNPSVTQPLIVPVPPAVITPPAPPPVSQSPLIASIVAPAVPPFTEILWPSTTGLAVGFVKRDGETLSLRSLDQTWKEHVASPLLKKSPGVDDRLALSGDGSLLARLTTFPKFSAQVLSLADNLVMPSYELATVGDSSQIVGFAGDRLVVRHDATAATSFDVITARTGKRYRAFTLPTPLSHTGITTVLSPDGKLLVAAGRMKVDGPATIVVYSLEDGRQLRGFAVPRLDSRWPIAPTGLAISPDGTKVVVMFEEAGGALIAAWNLVESSKQSAGKLIAVHELAAVPAVEHFNGSSIEWLNESTLLLYGRQLLDVATAKPLGDLGIDGVTAQHVLAADRIILVRGGTTSSTIADVKLDLSKSK